MTSRRTSVHAIAGETCGNVIIAKTSSIEPVFQVGHAAVVLERPPVPNAPERRDFVVTGGATRSKSQPAVRADPNWEDLGPEIAIHGDIEISRWRQFVVCIQGRDMATGASFAA